MLPLLCPLLGVLLAATPLVTFAGESREKMAQPVEGQQLAYLIYTPEDKEAKPADGWPLVLFLHGAGERGSDLDRVKVHGPPKLIGSNEHLARSVVVAPQCPAEKWWEAKTLKALVDEVLAAHPEIDRKRLYLTGLSMGGYGTWNFISEYPDYVAAAAPVCGGGNPNLLDILKDKPATPFTFTPEKLARSRALPLWAFHGEADNVVPASQSEELVGLLKKAGNRKVKLTLYPGVGHDSWSRTYDDPAFYEWLMAQRKD